SRASADVPGAVRQSPVGAQPRRAHLRFPLPGRDLRATAKAAIRLFRAAVARARTARRPGRPQARPQGGCSTRARALAGRRGAFRGPVSLRGSGALPRRARYRDAWHRLIDQDFDPLATLVGHVEDRAASTGADGIEQIVNRADARNVAEPTCKPEAKTDHANRHRNVGARAASALVGHANAEPARAVGWRGKLFGQPAVALTAAAFAATLAEGSEQLSGLGGGDLLLLE